MDPLRTLLSAALLALPVAGQFTPPGAGHGGEVAQLAPMPAKPERTRVLPGHRPRTLQVKFVEGSETRLRASGFEGPREQLAAVNSLLLEWGAVGRRMFTQDETWLADWVAGGEARSGTSLHDLNLFYFVDLAQDDQVAALCDALNAFPIVELAWPTPTGGDPVVPTCPAPVSAPALMVTPDFSSQQDYRDPAPAGVDAVYGNTFSGGTGAGLTVLDCETGWTDDHEDLVKKLRGNFVVWIPANNPWNHGTAVMGEILGEDNGFGVKGIAYGADALLSTHTPVGLPQNIPGSVANAAAAAQPGDVIVIEIQCFGGPPAPFPCEYDPATFATVQAATANGVHVFAAAGNGSNDLDSAAYGGAFDFSVKDSGAVIVGATNGVTLLAASFSNYGTRLTSSGWGGNVVSAGYGDLQSGTPQQDYTAIFNGTSSATPIVTGAAVILATMNRTAFGQDLTPQALRTLLAETGTLVGGTKIVGARPDVRRAIRKLGIPEIAAGGSFVPGGTIAITHWGDPGDAYYLLWSPGLSSLPVSLSPLGELFLNPAQLLYFPVQGVIGAGGSETDVYPLPMDASLTGLTTFFQGVQLFTNKPGLGSFSNWLSVQIR